jgi:pimeloyl-ACP methyl ester carboxylesterase
MNQPDKSVSPANAIILGSAVALAATGVFNARQAEAAERRYPPRGRFVEIGGIRLHYLEDGAGDPPVVLLHGNGAMAEDFLLSGLFEELARRRRVVAFDRPGFGYSERPRSHIWTPSAQAALIADAMHALDLDGAIVLGHSCGALVALALGLEHPDLVGGLVLLSGFYYPEARADVALLSGPAIPVVGDVMRYTLAPLIARRIAPEVISRIFAPRPVPHRFRESYPLDLALRPWQIRASAADAAMMVPAAARLSPHYGKLRVPTVILAGKEDRIVDYEAHSLRLHHAIGHSSFRLLSGLGHMPHYYAQPEIAEAVEVAAGGAGWAADGRDAAAVDAEAAFLDEAETEAEAHPS